MLAFALLALVLGGLTLALVLAGTVRVCERLRLDPLDALVWVGLADWPVEGAPETPTPAQRREAVDAWVVALANGPSLGARAAEGLAAGVAVTVAALETLRRPPAARPPHRSPSRA